MLRTLPTALALVLATLPGHAQAYVLEHDASGADIRWPSLSVSMYIDPTSLTVDATDAVAAAQRAAFHWAQAANVQLGLTSESTHGELGYDASNPSSNRNEIFFVDGDWDLDPMVVAETLVTSDATTHQILDADILLNEAQHKFGILPDSSQPGDGLDDDLESTITHEMGHAIGLAHNTTLDTATMYPNSQVGEVSIRDLSSDDVAGAQFLYESPVAAPSTSIQGCSSAPGSGFGGFGLLAALGLLLRSRRSALTTPWAP